MTTVTEASDYASMETRDENADGCTANASHLAVLYDDAADATLETENSHQQKSTPIASAQLYDDVALSSDTEDSSSHSFTVGKAIPRNPAEYDDVALNSDTEESSQSIKISKAKSDTLSTQNLRILHRKVSPTVPPRPASE